MAIEKIYPEVQFPVSRGTPMISPLIKWDHSEDWYVPCFEIQRKSESGERKVKISLDDLEYDYVVGHTIDGKNFIKFHSRFPFINRLKIHRTHPFPRNGLSIFGLGDYGHDEWSFHF